MCEKVDLSQGIGKLKGNIILWICSIGLIVLGIFLVVCYFHHGTGFESLCLGIFMIFVIFFPHKWMVITSLVFQILCSIYLVVAGIRIVIHHIEHEYDHDDKKHGSIVWVIIFFLAFAFVAVFAIFSCIVYVKSLLASSGGGGRGSYSKTTSTDST
ncbi:unnamed protein product [Caenorhabditis angaria]|uniref:Uncharacterized protein n=1 Tax=Caenorhabditis angaria TaxID=860376 RepID=A0A9P1MX32_9PELO|nr:unnamed protein product [Caenorhabditis angaria]